MFHDIPISLTSFNVSKQRLDKFYGEFLHKNQQYKSMWKVFIFIFTLSHRQSQVDRDFSINKKIVIENLHSSSLSAQWIVYDYLKASKKNIHDIKITIKMLTSCKGVELLTSLFVLVYTVRQKVFDIKSFI